MTRKKQYKWSEAWQKLRQEWCDKVSKAKIESSWTWAELADAMNVSRWWITACASPKRTELLSFADLIKFAKFCRLTPEQHDELVKLSVAMQQIE